MVRKAIVWTKEELKTFKKFINENPDATAKEIKDGAFPGRAKGTLTRIQIQNKLQSVAKKIKQKGDDEIEAKEESLKN